MKRLLLLLIVCFKMNMLIAQAIYSKEVAAQIKQVENNLGGEIKLEGKTGDNILERMAHFNVKGLSIAVVHHYKIVWAKGYGWANEQEQRPVTPKTLFEPGSISKSFNALGILKLVQDQQLDLNTDINTYLKSWRFPYDAQSRHKKITLAHLLSHTAGLTVHGFPGYNRDSLMPTVPQILNGAAPANTPAVRSEFEPGLKFKYSGGGTMISQLILTDITQIPYDQYMSEHVFKPLGMTNTFFTQPPPPGKLQLLATGYREDGSVVDGGFHVYPEQAAAGLWTTPADLCKYIIETQLSYEGKSAKVLNPAMTSLRLTPYIDESSALGVFIENRNGFRYFQHGAGNEGFRGFYYGSLEGGNGVAVFVNSDDGRILPEVINSVATVYNWKGFYNPLIKKEVTVSNHILQRYPGIYLYEDQFANIIKKEDGYYFCGNGGDHKMYFSSETDFFNTEFPTEKHFITLPSGVVTGYVRTVDGRQLPLATKVLNPDTIHGSTELLNAIGWNLLEHRNYDEAIRYLNRGLQLYPHTLLLEGNLAHCFLFKNNYDAALKIYKAHLNEKLGPGVKWTDMIRQDFALFKSKGMDSNLMDKALADLQQGRPGSSKKK